METNVRSGKLKPGKLEAGALKNMNQTAKKGKQTDQSNL